ncbi:MAG: GC-type dockerin domain-anchored protein [Planctomycetota bacterium]
MNSNRKLGLVAACGLATGLAAGVAQAQPFVVNLTGATLQQNFFIGPASTFDFIDVDGDLNTTQDQLAPTITSRGSIPADTYYAIQYRAVGSGNGIRELLAWGQTYAIYDDFDAMIDDGMGGMIPNPSDTDGEDRELNTASNAYINREFYINGGAGTGIFTVENPGSAPYRSLTDSTFSLTQGTLPADGGWRADIASSDVPAEWFAEVSGGAADWKRTPGQAGYGLNPNTSAGIDGDPANGGQDNSLIDFGALPAGLVVNSSTAFTPVAMITNLGTGIEQLTVTEIQHGLLAGRLPTGENIVFHTRDTGSGTHNAFVSSMGIDPSWATGERVGVRTSSSTNDRLGPDYVPGNAGGSSRMEDRTENNRLSVGYTGGERGGSDWLVSGKLEVVAIQFDQQGGTQYVRPHIDNVLDNDTPNSFRSGGPAVLVTLGDPDQGVTGSNPAGTNDMENQEAATYINNIVESLVAFNGNPTSPSNAFTPGELLAVLFVPPQALLYQQDLNDPNNWVPNANTSNLLRVVVRAVNRLADDGFLDGNYGYYTVNRDTGLLGGSVNAGRVPDRAAGIEFSDGNLTAGRGDDYITQGGTVISDATSAAVPMRNRISGDFDGNGLRNIGDTAEMIAAWRDRNGGPAWIAPNGTGSIAGEPGTDAVIELLGDFNGDGSFTAEDVRYFADGLAIVGGVLDREAGFIAVDDAFGGNFFGTTLANGSYVNGDSRGDVAGGAGTSPGWAPTGADGTVDAADIDYVYAQFMQFGDMSADWADVEDALRMDLSGDMDGDLDVDADDVDELLDILDTDLGDVDLDGDVDGDDLAIANANLGNAGGWADGDVNGDGIVDGDDIAIIGGPVCLPDITTDGTNPGDANFLVPDGAVTVADLSTFVEQWIALNVAVADITTDGANPGDANFLVPDGVVTVSDLSTFVELWLAGCP